MLRIISQTVAEILSALPKDEKIYYRANPGNAGDALIATGTFHLLSHLKIDYEILDVETFDPDGKIVLYAGGGNFNHIYGDAREFIQAIHSRVKKFILLPHTITGNEDLLADLGSNCIIFAREHISYEHLSKHSNQCQVYIDHDMALNMDVQKVLSAKYPGTISLILRKIYNNLIKSSHDRIPPIRMLLSSFFFERDWSRRNLGTLGVFFRDDVEASGRDLPDDNADLSKIYFYGTRNKYYTDYTVWRLFNYLDKFDDVRTDRLHVCIAAAMLNKKVEFNSNSYFKCKAVYEYSLKSNYPNINWLG